MSWDTFLTTLQSSLGSQIPQILGALLILLIGWIIAAVVRNVIRAGLSRLHVNTWIETHLGSKII